MWISKIRITCTKPITWINGSLIYAVYNVQLQNGMRLKIMTIIQEASFVHLEVGCILSHYWKTQNEEYTDRDKEMITDRKALVRWQGFISIYSQKLHEKRVDLETSYPYFLLLRVTVPTIHNTLQCTILPANYRIDLLLLKLLLLLELSMADAI